MLPTVVALHFLAFVALLSVNLGVLNLLPLPILDGGHLVFFGIEAVIGRPVPLPQGRGDG